jgi:hypothetical protein
MQFNSKTEKMKKDLLGMPNSQSLYNPENGLGVPWFRDALPNDLVDEEM